MAEVERASREGWQVFAPAPDPLLGAYREYVEANGFVSFSEFKALTR